MQLPKWVYLIELLFKRLRHVLKLVFIDISNERVEWVLLRFNDARFVESKSTLLETNATFIAFQNWF